MKTITLAIPCKAALQARFSLCLLQTLNQIQTKTGYKPLVRILVGKSNIVHARSILLTEWYEASTDDDLFFFLDADQTFTIEDIEAIVKKEGDVVSGIYLNGAGYPTCYPLMLDAFQSGADDRLLYSGCGFMLIRRPILRKVIQLLEKETGASRYTLNHDDEMAIIPFFQTKCLLRSELSPQALRGDWLGEDYSFCWRVRECGGTLRAFFSRTLGHEIPQVSYLPDGFFPAKKKAVGSVPSIVYYCGASLVKFSPKTKGLGGSEQAVVELSKAWAAKGISVCVYGNVYPGNEDGVEYRPTQEFDSSLQYSTLILWRSFGASVLPLVTADRILIDLHDIPRKEFFPADLVARKQATLCVKSQFHRSLLPHLPDSCFFVQPNGIATSLLEKYKPVVSRKEPHRFIWTSSYDRGLPEFLQNGWTRIRELLPDATLHLYYGYDLCPPDVQRELKALLHSVEGHVVDHGKVDAIELAKARWASSYHVYVTEFPEIDCLSIRESVVAECIPIVLQHAVFSERPAVYVQHSQTLSPWDQVVGILRRLTSDTSAQEKLRKTLRDQLHDTHLECEWATVAGEWTRVLMKQ
jgi:hypothetical protein